MATIYDLKLKFQTMLRPIVTLLHCKGITPNQVTWAALILSISIGVLMAYTAGNTFIFLIIPFVMFIRMAMNAIDGMLAKEFNMQTKKGAILNEMSDVVADAALYLPLALVSGVSAPLVVLFVIVGIFTEMAGVLAQAVSNERRYDGPMGKSDRAFVFGLICLLLGVGIEAGWWLNGLLLISIILAVLTTLNRTKGALK